MYGHRQTLARWGSTGVHRCPVGEMNEVSDSIVDPREGGLGRTLTHVDQETKMLIASIAPCTTRGIIEWNAWTSQATGKPAAFCHCTRLSPPKSFSITGIRVGVDFGSTPDPNLVICVVALPPFRCSICDAKRHSSSEQQGTSCRQQ